MLLISLFNNLKSVIIDELGANSNGFCGIWYFIN